MLSLKERIESIPLDDLKRIERLFRSLVWDEQFAYTLFGTKPMTIAHTHRAYQVYGFIHPCSLGLLWSDWKVWECYQHLFPSRSFALSSQNDGDQLEISLINKSAVGKTIEKNLSLFQAKLACKDKPRILISRILDSKNIWKDGLNKSQTLLGILLGYGSINAQGFEDYYTTSLKFILPLPSLSQSEPMLYLLALPFFTSFSDAETTQLRQTYSLERARILNYYAKGNFLMITLEKLSS